MDSINDQDYCSYKLVAKLWVKSLGILRGRFIFTKVQVIHSVEIYEESAVPS